MPGTSDSPEPRCKGGCYIVPMATLTLSPDVLEWAANKVGLSLLELAGKVAPPSKTEAVLQGKVTPTQIEKIASISRTPFGFLFLESPPTIERPELPDLRQLKDAEPLSEDFYETLSDVLRKQEWFADYLQDGEAEGPAFVGRYADRSDPELVPLVAKEITETLSLTWNDRRSSATPEAFYSLLVGRLEESGVLVFKNGVVKSNTRRPLSASEFRGFAIVDRLAPAIFVNGADWPTAWVFTLIHEAAHIWLGHSGVSNVSASTATVSDANVETLCNRIAAEVLTPHAEFLAAWSALDTSHFIVLSRRFRVSQLVIARRALEFGLITAAEYGAAAEASRKAANRTSGGGDGFANILIRNSKRLTKAVVARAMAGDLMLRDAGGLLNASPRSVVELARRGE